MVKIATPHKSLLDTFLTPALRVELGARTTRNGFRLSDVVKSGIENPDSSIGIYAPDAHSYAVFSPLFLPVIVEYHGYDVEKSAHKHDLDISVLHLPPLDPEGRFIVSTRVRVGRNLKNFPLVPGISDMQRKEVERKTVSALRTLKGGLAGTYYPLTRMSEKARQKLVSDHFLFKQGDRFLESAGANRHWPSGRGIFHSKDKRFLVWVNEEDHLRIISMETGGNLLSVFERLVRAIKTLEEKLVFEYSPQLGYISSCPTNLGTAMRASVHVKLPRLSAQKNFKKICADLGLSVRGLHGEHSESKEGIFDISNKRRLGISEVEIVKQLHKGVERLIHLEQKL